MQQPSEQGGTPPIAQTPVPTDASTDKPTHTYPSADNTELAGTRSDAREQIIEHTGHIVSYNNVWNEPNWVAWELTREETRAPYRKRNSDFEPDPLVEGKKITTHDYTKSGYTRGHMAPSGDMKWDEDAMNECRTSVHRTRNSTPGFGRRSKASVAPGHAAMARCGYAAVPLLMTSI